MNYDGSAAERSSVARGEVRVRNCSKFRQTDVKRLLKAAQDAGCRVILEVCPDGTIRLVPFDGTKLPANEPGEPEEW